MMEYEDDDDNEPTTKLIQFLPTTLEKQKIIKKKERVRRVVANTEKWTLAIRDDFLQEPLKQQEVIQYMVQHIRGVSIVIDSTIQEYIRFIKHQIHLKMNGYKSQDQLKNKYNKLQFIDFDCILEKLFECQNKCYYCKESVLVLYEYARDPKQWTVERIDNKLGHTKTNIEIACLQCNLRRRNMLKERYLLTKQIQHIVKVG